MHTLAVGQWPLPGEAGFPLNAMYVKPRDRNEEGQYSSLNLTITGCQAGVYNISWTGYMGWIWVSIHILNI